MTNAAIESIEVR